MCGYSQHLVTSRPAKVRRQAGFDKIYQLHHFAVSPQSENQTWQCAFFPAWAERELWICVTGSAEMRYTVMSAPISDDEGSGHQMYAPKRLREQTRIPPAPTAPRHFAAMRASARSRSTSCGIRLGIRAGCRMKPAQCSTCGEA
jgi:hypothetical protein